MLNDEPDLLNGGIYTVTEIADAIRQNLETEFPSIRVIGEVANFKAHTSGHFYLTLRDGQNLLKIVMFKKSTYGLAFRPEDGMMVIAEGRVSHYGGSGQTQLIAERIELSGRGPYELRFRKLLAALMSEGLTDPAAKRPLPKYPGRIAVITSASGAAIRDITRTIARRWPVAVIEHIHADVQGVAASAAIIEAFRKADSMEDVDVVILARGGGSIEDLQAFNEEETARAVSASRHPVVTGIGHEIDTTICDYVSDLRAATPTAAAELATPLWGEVMGNIDRLLGDIERRYRESSGGKLGLLEYILRSSAFPALRHKVEMLAMRVDEKLENLVDAGEMSMKTTMDRIDDSAARLSSYLAGGVDEAQTALACIAERLASADPARRVEILKNSVAAHENIMKLAVHSGSAMKRGACEGLIRAMNGLCPENILKRGYSYCVSGDGITMISSVEDVSAGDEIQVNFFDGRARCAVKGKRREELWQRSRVSKNPSAGSKR